MLTHFMCIIDDNFSTHCCAILCSLALLNFVFANNIILNGQRMCLAPRLEHKTPISLSLVENSYDCNSLLPRIISVHSVLSVILMIVYLMAFLIIVLVF
jgi:hypothetical protein